MKNKFKLSVSRGDEEVSMIKESSSVTLDEYHSMCKYMALALGYSKEAVKVYFDEK